MKHLTFPLALLLILVHFPTATYAWSNKEHSQLARIAALRLIAAPDTPADMKAWLTQALPHPDGDMAAEKEYFLHKRIGMYPRDVDGLPFWATVPDSDAGAAVGKKVEPFGVVERELHFIDMEYFVPEEAKRVYADNLSGKPKLEDVKKDMKDWRWARSGMLPFRVEQCYGELVRSIRAGRLVDERGKFPADDHATKWAGFLAHYAADNTQPQHATIDYKSSVYFKNPKKAPNIHADVEYGLVDGENADYPEIRAEMWDAFVKALDEVKDPSTTTDVWTSTVEVSLFSYDNLPLIGKAAIAGYGAEGDQPFNADAFAHTKGTVRGKEVTFVEMKAGQLALGVKRIEKLWLQAWKEAHASAISPAH